MVTTSPLLFGLLPAGLVEGDGALGFFVYFTSTPRSSLSSS